MMMIYPYYGASDTNEANMVINQAAWLRGTSHHLCNWQEEVASTFEIGNKECPTDDRLKWNEFRLCQGMRPEVSEAEVMINCALVFHWGIHRLHQHKIQRALVMIQKVVEHHQKASKHVLSIAMLVLGTDEHTVISVEAWVALQVVSH